MKDKLALKKEIKKLNYIVILFIIILGLGFIETSAYKSTNVDQAFQRMIEDVFQKFHKQLENKDEDDDDDFGTGNGVLLDSNTNKKEKEKKCCEK